MQLDKSDMGKKPEELLDDREFNIFLEFRLCDYIDKSDNQAAAGLWCDGTRFVAMVGDSIAAYLAWIGSPDAMRESIYNLFVHLGKVALGLLARGESIQAAFPEAKGPEDISFDNARRRIEIRVD